MLTRSTILKSKSSEYMSEEQLSFFKDILTEMRQQISEDIQQCRSVLLDNDLEADPIDTATQEEIKQITLLRVQRDTHTLHEIEQALERIHSKDYGYCIETGDPIGLPRLLANPVATLCIDAGQNAEFIHRTSGGDSDHNQYRAA